MSSREKDFPMYLSFLDVYRLLLICFFFLSAILLSGNAAAQSDCADKQIVNYDGCLLPDDPAQANAWEQSSGFNGEPFIDNCQLVMPVNDKWGYIGYERYEAALVSAVAYSIEARIRIDSYLTEDPFLVNASVGVGDGVKTAGLSLSYSEDGTGYATVCDSNDCHHLELDLSIYHEVRIQVRKDGNAEFFVDGSLFHEVEYNSLSDTNIQPFIAVFGGAESVSYWDYVRYDVCPLEATKERPPVSDLVGDAISEVDNIDTNNGIKSAIKNKLEDILTTDDPREQGSRIIDAARFLFRKRFAGVVGDDEAGSANNLRTRLHFALDTVAPRTDLTDGFGKGLKIYPEEQTTPIVIPGIKDISMKFTVHFEPFGPHHSNSENSTYGLRLSWAAVDPQDGSIVYAEKQMIDYDVPAEFASYDIELYWDGRTLYGGPPVDPGQFYLDAVVEYLQFDPDSGDTDKVLAESQSALSSEMESIQCSGSSYPICNANRTRKFKMNLGTFNWPFLGEERSKYAAMAAADIWNSEANSGSYKYAGDTDILFSPHFPNPFFLEPPLLDVTCWAMDIYHTHIQAHDLNSTGTTKSNCCGINCCDYAVIFIDTVDSSGMIRWDITGMISLFAHEMGHSHGLGHPNNREAALMCNSMESNCQDANGVAKLSQWDITCIQDIAGVRRAQPMYVSQRDTGLFPEYGEAYEAPADFLTSKAGIEFHDTWNLAYLGGADYGALWLAYWGADHIREVDSVWKYDSIGPVPMHWKEELGDPNNPYQYYVTYAEHVDSPTITDPDATHLLRYSKAFNNFTSDIRSGGIRYCLEMRQDSWNTCKNESGYRYARSNRKPSFAYDEVSNITLYSWVNYDLDLGYSPIDYKSDILIALGHIHENTFPTPLRLEIGTTGEHVNSRVSPGLACKPSAGPDGHDCLIAYVPYRDEEGAVYITAFSVGMGANYLELDKSQSCDHYKTNLKTSSDIALWHNHGKWWMAIQSLGSHQISKIYSSDDGLSWTKRRDVGYSTQGFSVAIGPPPANFGVILYSR